MPKKNETAANEAAKPVPVKVTLITSLKAIDAAIISMHERGQSLQTDMHTIACSVLAHVGKNRDTRVVLKLINAMPDLARINSLKLWFETFGNVKFDGKDVRLTDNACRIADAMKKPFWKFKATEGVPYEPVDIPAMIASMVKRLEKDAKITGMDHSAVIHKLRMAGNEPSMQTHVMAHDAH